MLAEWMPGSVAGHDELIRVVLVEPPPYSAASW
jgi:hypothetical protein